MYNKTNYIIYCNMPFSCDVADCLNLLCSSTPLWHLTLRSTWFCGSLWSLWSLDCIMRSFLSVTYSDKCAILLIILTVIMWWANKILMKTCSTSSLLSLLSICGMYYRICPWLAKFMFEWQYLRRPPDIFYTRPKWGCS